MSDSIYPNNHDQVGSADMEPAEALNLGWFVGALMANAHMKVEPIMNGNDYTNQVEATIPSGPTGQPVKFLLTINILED